MDAFFQKYKYHVEFTRRDGSFAFLAHFRTLLDAWTHIVYRKIRQPHLTGRFVRGDSDDSM